MSKIQDNIVQYYSSNIESGTHPEIEQDYISAIQNEIQREKEYFSVNHKKCHVRCRKYKSLIIHTRLQNKVRH